MKQAEEGKLPGSGGVAGTAPDTDFGQEKVCPGHLRLPFTPVLTRPALWPQESATLAHRCILAVTGPSEGQGVPRVGRERRELAGNGVGV